MSRKIGIYAITHTITGKVYIGGSSNIIGRWATHRKFLRENKHHSVPLQKAWNNCEEKNFIFNIIELIEKPLLIEREQFYLDKLKATNPDYGFNLCPIAGKPLGYKHSNEMKEKARIRFTGKKFTKEHKEKISNSLKGRRPSENTIKASVLYWKGRKFSEERKASFSAIRKGKKLNKVWLEKLKWHIAKRRLFNKEKINLILQDRNNGMTIRELAKKYNCSASPVARICKGNYKEKMEDHHGIHVSKINIRFKT